MQVDVNRIPVLPVVSRFSEVFQFDPLKMISSGTLVAAIPIEHIGAARRSLENLDIVFADIGQIIEDKGVQITQNGQVALYKEIHCEEDELARMWERGTNENTNGLIRQYFPKHKEFCDLRPEDVAFVEKRLNTRPRKCLSFQSPMVFLINHGCT